MTTNILSDKWRGELAEPIDPAAVRFTASSGDFISSCHGCLFSGQRATVCDRANEIAATGGLPECSPRTGPNYIYVLDKSDPRQMDLVGMVEQGEGV